jgi:glycosyltransferase involved in cell wall biosynthesis
MLENRDIICFSTSLWGFREGSRENIVKRLAQKNRVLYVDSPVDFLQVVRYPHVRKYFFNRSRKADPSTRIFLLRPFPQLPFGAYCGCINAINQFFLYLQVRRRLARLCFTKPILLIYHPLYVSHVRRYGRALCVYHCIDNYEEEIQNATRKKHIRASEEKLIQAADIVFVQNLFLRNKFARYGIKLRLLAPGIDDSLFKKSAPAVSSRGNDAVTIGFVGSIDDRFDWRIVEAIAARHPQWNIVLVGPFMTKDTHIRALARYKNIVRTGFVKGEELARYYSGFTAGIIPYYVNAFTDGIFPIKLFEYFYFGIPVVSTPFESAKEFAGDNSVYLATPEDFVATVEKVAKGQEPAALREKRMRLAGDNTWSHKMRFIEENIEAALHG